MTVFNCNVTDKLFMSFHDFTFEINAFLKHMQYHRYEYIETQFRFYFVEYEQFRLSATFRGWFVQPFFKSNDGLKCSKYIDCISKMYLNEKLLIHKWNMSSGCAVALIWNYQCSNALISYWNYDQMSIYSSYHMNHTEREKKTVHLKCFNIGEFLSKWIENSCT